MIWSPSSHTSRKMPSFDADDLMATSYPSTSTDSKFKSMRKTSLREDDNMSSYTVSSKKSNLKMSGRKGDPSPARSRVRFRDDDSDEDDNKSIKSIMDKYLSDMDDDDF